VTGPRNPSQPKDQHPQLRTPIPGPNSQALRAREDAHMAPGLQGYAVMAGIVVDQARGSAVSDVDWESKDGHYRVRIDGDWYDVPEDAVITEPNRVGRTMVWPIRGYQGLSIRCFIPGSMT